MQVVLIGGHALLRGGLKMIIAAHWPGARIVEAVDFIHLKTLLADPGGPDLVLVDTESLRPSWPRDLDVLQRRYAEARIVVLASGVGLTEVRRAIRSGVAGYVSKENSVAEFVAALHKVLKGCIQVPPLVVADDRLTPRQRELLPLIAEGYSNKEIAHSLGISEGTVKLHMRNLFRSLGVRNRAQAVAAAGLVPGAEE